MGRVNTDCIAAGGATSDHRVDVQPHTAPDGDRTHGASWHKTSFAHVWRHGLGRPRAHSRERIGRGIGRGPAGPPSRLNGKGRRADCGDDEARGNRPVRLAPKPPLPKARTPRWASILRMGHPVACLHCASKSRVGAGEELKGESRHEVAPTKMCSRQRICSEAAWAARSCT